MFIVETLGKKSQSAVLMQRDKRLVIDFASVAIHFPLARQHMRKAIGDPHPN